MKRIETILTTGQPVGEANKRPFIIAAKLLFLVPQRDDEDVSAYSERLRTYLFQAFDGFVLAGATVNVAVGVLIFGYWVLYG